MTRYTRRLSTEWLIRKFKKLSFCWITCPKFTKIKSRKQHLIESRGWWTLSERRISQYILKKTIQYTIRKHSHRTSRTISHPINNLKLISSVSKTPKKPIQWFSRKNRTRIRIENKKFVRTTSIKKKEKIRKYFIFSQESLICRHFQQWHLVTAWSITVPRGLSSSKWVKIILWQLKMKIQCPMISLLEFRKCLLVSSLIICFLFSQLMNFSMLEVSANSGLVMLNRHGILLLNARCIFNCWLASSAKT